MELFKEDDISFIAKQCCNRFSKVNHWSIEEYSDKTIGYLGDHFKLKVQVEKDGSNIDLKFFVKCIPRFDDWKTQFLRELGFFKKEFIMLNSLLPKFNNYKDTRKWRPKVLFLKEELFVFEDVVELGYVMPYYKCVMSVEILTAAIKTLARFHAQSYIYEEHKSKKLGRTYRIWEDYSNYLQEPLHGLDWRNTGMKAVVDFLKINSKYKSIAEFDQRIEKVIPELFKRAFTLMEPNSKYRNVVVHRDLWTNNMLFKKQPNSDYHVLFVDFQTLLYCSPMLDLSSLIYFNTTKKTRNTMTSEFIEIYYKEMCKEMIENNIVSINTVVEKNMLFTAYEEAIVFGITQAALIIPIAVMDSELTSKIFWSPDIARKVNVISRSQEIIDVAKTDSSYYHRLTDIFDEIVERYVFPFESSED